MNRLLPALLLLGLLLAATPATAAPAQSTMVAVCAPTYTVVATASIGAGDINFCVYYTPITATSASTFQVISAFTAPPTVAPLITTAAAAFIQNSGCTEGTATAGVPTTNGILGTVVNYASIWTMTAEQCDGAAVMSLTIGVVPLQVYTMAIPITVQTENRRQDNYDYLCDAPAIAPNAHSTTGTTCNDPTLNLDITDDTTADGALTVDVADDTTNDGFLSVPPATISNVSVNGTFPSTIDVDLADVGDADGLGGIDVGVLILAWLVALVWCLRQAKLFAALAAVIGIACVLIPGPDWITWVGILFFTLALWLEAVARERLPYHWFNNTKPT